MREQPRHRGLAGAGRAPEDHRARGPASNMRASGAPGRADDPAPPPRQRLRAQPVGERARRDPVEPGGFKQRRISLLRSHAAAPLPAVGDALPRRRRRIRRRQERAGDHGASRSRGALDAGAVDLDDDIAGAQAHSPCRRIDSRSRTTTPDAASATPRRRRGTGSHRGAGERMLAIVKVLRGGLSGGGSRCRVSCVRRHARLELVPVPLCRAR